MEHIKLGKRFHGLANGTHALHHDKYRPQDRQALVLGEPQSEVPALCDFSSERKEAQYLCASNWHISGTQRKLRQIRSSHHQLGSDAKRFE